jgi:hypothetical protein
MVRRKLSRVNDMKYEYVFLKFPDSTIAAISEIEVNTQQKQYWKFDALIKKKEFKTKHKLELSFFRTQRWLKEKHPEFFI